MTGVAPSLLPELNSGLPEFSILNAQTGYTQFVIGEKGTTPLMCRAGGEIGGAAGDQ